MRKGTTAVTMLLIGVAVGGLTALLLAPERGRTTRRKIRRGVGNWVEKGRDWVDEAGIRDRAGSIAGRFRKSSEDDY